MIVRRTLNITLFIGIFAIVLLWAFEIQSSLIQTQIINGYEIRTLNINSYISNINNTWNNFPLAFETIIPPREFNSDLINNILAILNWICFPINFLLWLVRMVCWLIKLLLAVIGFETTTVNGIYRNGIVNVISWIVDYLMIPYV